MKSYREPYFRSCVEFVSVLAIGLLTSVGSASGFSLYWFNLSEKEEFPVFQLMSNTGGAGESAESIKPVFILWPDGTCVRSQRINNHLAPMTWRSGEPFETGLMTIYSGPYKISRIDSATVQGFMDSLVSMDCLEDPGIAALRAGGFSDISFRARIADQEYVGVFNHVIYEESNPGHIMLEDGVRPLASGESAHDALESATIDYKRNRLVFESIWGEVLDVVAVADDQHTSDITELKFVLKYSNLTSSGS